MVARKFFCTFVLVFSFGIYSVESDKFGAFKKKEFEKKKLKVFKITAEVPKAYIVLTSVSFEQ